MLLTQALATTVTLDLMELLKALLILSGIILAIYLIVLIARLNRTVGKIDQLVDEVNEPITRSLSDLPDLVQKLDEVADHVNVLSQSARESVPAVLKDIEGVTGTVREGVEAVGGAAKSVGQGISSFFRPGQAARGPHLNTILDIVRQGLSVVTFLAGRKKSNARKKRK